MREDIPLLIHHYLSRYQERYNRQEMIMPPALLQQLYSHSWPGNVRELRNTIKRLVLLGPEEGFDPAGTASARQPNAAEPSAYRFEDTFTLPYNDAKAEVVRRFSESYLRNLLHRHQGNVTSAAVECGLERQGLQRIMRRYAILSNDFR
jgi:DNA-binding NtrC family response regulator